VALSAVQAGSENADGWHRYWPEPDGASGLQHFHFLTQEAAMQFDDTQSARVANHQACVVFDKKTGIISHIHQSITFEGAKAPSKEQFELRAKQLAQQFAGPTKKPLESPAKELAREFSAKFRGIKLDRLEVLHVRPDELTGQPVKVDTKSYRLVPIPNRASARKSKKRIQSRKS
jgi:hypothetical protein